MTTRKIRQLTEEDKSLIADYLEIALKIALRTMSQTNHNRPDGKMERPKTRRIQKPSPA